MNKEDMMNKISMALKDPILQQGFEVICGKLARLEKENEELKERLCNIQTQKVEKLGKAEELILKLSTCLESHSNNNFEYELLKETEQFLKED